VGVTKELAADAISGIVIIYPIAVDNSFPLNHLLIMAVYAISRLSEAVPKSTLPANIIQKLLKNPPNAMIV